MQFRNGLILSLFLSVSSIAFAQKQTDNVLAPTGVKIDGKITEWASTPFQVNKPTQLSYIISNDARNLYLVLQSSDSLVNSRIMSTGIEFMINTAGKKKEGPMIYFPLIDKASAAVTAGTTPPEPIERNKKLLAGIKEIKLSGFKDIKDPTISIYNEFGIKGTGTFDEKKNFIYELAIPLSTLGVSADGVQELAYNIKINGSSNSQGAGNFMGGDRGFGGGGPDRVIINGGGNFDGGVRNRGTFNQNSFYEATDFWVDLKLVKAN